jgi:hypothetical protein
MSTRREPKTKFTSATPSATSPTFSIILPAKAPLIPLPGPWNPPSSEQKQKTSVVKQKPGSVVKQKPGSVVKQKPGSVVKQKPGRSVVDAIDREIKGREIGRGFSSIPWLRFKLSTDDYKLWQQHHLDDQFVKYKLRYDYFPSASLFVLRMPRRLHEQLAEDIVDEIKQQLRSIASGASPAAKFAKNIRSTGSTTLKFDDQYGKHDPDASFTHIDAKYPGVVIEVSYSQKKQDLPRLADDYILGSDARIRVVVGIDLDYRGKRATISIWRPRIETDATGEEELVTHQTLSDEVLSVTFDCYMYSHLPGIPQCRW